jgi:recombination protein RecR
MYSEKIQKLIDLFSKFPGIGPKTATRFVFYLLTRTSEKDNEELARTILDLKKTLKVCQFCFKFFDSQNKENQLCEICSNPGRDRNLLCIVEKETDLVSIEDNKLYQGLYFILGGKILGSGKNDFEKEMVQKLKQRIINPFQFGLANTDIKEIILALNPTAEGVGTELYLERELKVLGKKITRLGLGLPIGGELEYADKETILSAFENRK